MDKTINQWSRAELMALPQRDWQLQSEYDSVLILSTRRKHDSGWAMMAIIGIVKGEPVEIAAQCCDDIEWKLPPMISFGNGLSIGNMRMDCALKSGAVHAWQRGSKFRVGCAVSSTEIEVFKAKQP